MSKDAAWGVVVGVVQRVARRGRNGFNVDIATALHGCLRFSSHGFELPSGN